MILALEYYSRIAPALDRGDDPVAIDHGRPWSQTVVDPLRFPIPLFNAAGKLMLLSGDGAMPLTLTLGAYRLEAEP